VAVCADVNLTAMHRTGVKRTLIERKKKVACSFDVLERKFVNIDQLPISDGPSMLSEMVITVDLKNIRVATTEERRSARQDVRTISMEVIDHKSIDRVLAERSTVGIVSSDPRRVQDVCSASFVRLWAQQNPDHRYWLCDRCADGNVIVKTCLNEAGQLECFGNICNDNNGVPWVTVFREQKKSNEEFQIIDENTVLIFCFLRESSYRDVSYLGHLLVKKTMPCCQVSDKIVNEFAHLSEDQPYKVHLAQDGGHGQDLSCEESVLEKCGVRSGSVLVVEQLAGNEHEFAENSSEPYQSLEGDGLNASNDSRDSNKELGHKKPENDTPSLPSLTPTTDSQPSTETAQSNYSQHAGIVSDEALETPTGNPDVNGSAHLDGRIPPGSMKDRTTQISPSQSVLETTKHATGALQAKAWSTGKQKGLQTDSSSSALSCSGINSNPVGESPPLATDKDDYVVEDERCAQRNGNGLLDGSNQPSETRKHSEEKRTPVCMDPEAAKHQSKSEMKNAHGLNMTEDESDIDSAMEFDKELTDAVKGWKETLLEDVRKEVTEPIIKEIKKVRGAVTDVSETAKATLQEVCKANLMADIQLEKLMENNTHLQLNDRDGQEAFMMADEYVEDPIFVLNHQCDYRMRVRLVHKHQSNAANFRIKYLSVKPSDGIELGMATSITRSPSEGNEVVSLLRFDNFQSVSLSSTCPQFGKIEDKYVDLGVTIGVERDSSVSELKTVVELKGRVLCHMVAGDDLMKARSFRRFALTAWKNSPQWIRDGARGAIILTTSGLDKTIRCGQMISLPGLGSVISSLFILPCFRLDRRQLVE